MFIPPPMNPLQSPFGGQPGTPSLAGAFDPKAFIQQANAAAQNQWNTQQQARPAAGAFPQTPPGIWDPEGSLTKLFSTPNIGPKLYEMFQRFGGGASSPFDVFSKALPPPPNMFDPANYYNP